MKKISLIIYFAFTGVLTCLSQANTSYLQDSIDTRKLYPIYKMQVLSQEDTDFILDSVLNASIRYKVSQYKKIYNIDSLFADSLSKKSFLQNPYMAEYAMLREGYIYKPVFKVENMRFGGYGFEKVYVKNVFEITKTDCFIRLRDSINNILPDTIMDWRAGENPPNQVCGIYDNYYVVEFNPYTKELRIIGGCLPKVQIKETDYDARSARDYINYSTLYGQARAINFASQHGSEHLFSDAVLLVCVPCESDTSIGSLVLHKGSNYNLYCISGRPLAHLNRYKGWLVVVKIPDPEKWISNSHRPDEIIPGEDWDNVEMIRFVSSKNYLNMSRIGYVPGYPYYEERMTFKNTPDSIDDNKVKVRGVTLEEMDSIKKKLYYITDYIDE